jgi:acylphosphatase
MIGMNFANDSLPTRVHLHIVGRVQGVGYRAATRQQATALGLRGWVRNLPDGSVEAQAQGPGQAVQALVQWCHQGPPLAAVSAVEVRTLPVLPTSEAAFDVLWH